MNIRNLFLFLFSALGLSLTAQRDPLPYRLYTGEGKPVKFKKLVRAAGETDVILFGELHNSAVAHWLQLELARSLDSFDLGLEMFETDEQRAVEGFRRGRVSYAQLDSLTGGLWPNFETDYLPIVELARTRGGKVVATNVPRRYARQVFRGGFEALAALPDEEQALLPPLPVPYDPELPGYRRMLEMMPGGHGGATFPMAQAIKDASMGYRIAQAARAGRPLLHLNGGYHSDDYEGIGWYLAQYAPELRRVTVSTVEQEDLSELEAAYAGKADFILVVPAVGLKTY